MRTGHNGAIATTKIEAPVSISEVKSYIQSCYTAVIMLQSEQLHKADVEVYVLLPFGSTKGILSHQMSIVYEQK